MNPIKTVAAVAVLAVVLIIAWQTIGAAARQAAVSQPEEEAVATEAPAKAPTHTPRPTLTPLATRFQEIVGQLTTAEELAGVWAYSKGSLGNRYYQFNQDGTWRSAPTRERLSNAPGVTGEFWFEGTKLNLPEFGVILTK